METTGTMKLMEDVGSSVRYPNTRPQFIDIKRRKGMKCHCVLSIYSLLVVLYLYMYLAMNKSTGLTITAWNIRSLNGAKPYLKELTQLSDVMFICEHRLYKSELFKLHNLGTNFEICGKSSNDLDEWNQSKHPGHCGVAMMWAKSISHRVRIRECNSDRICILEVYRACFGRSLFIVGVYLPQRGCTATTFKEHLDELESIVNRCTKEGEIIIIGDTNTHFGCGIAPRFNGTTTKNGKLLNDLTNEYNLHIIDGDDTICHGPTYTFNVEGVGCSYIDHCIVSDLLKHNVTWCLIHNERKINTSDHLPISTGILIDEDLEYTSIHSTRTNYIKWEAIPLEEIHCKYTLQLQTALQPVHDKLKKIEQAGILKNPNVIDNILNEMIECMKRASDYLPKRKYNKALKPYWSRTLSELNNAVKTLRNGWIQNGKHRNDNRHFLEYKEAKRKFRKAQKIAEYEYEVQNMQDICEKGDIDQRYFWHLVNKSRHHKEHSTHPIKTSEKQILSDPKEICKAWKNYFQSLYTPNSTDKYDQAFTDHVERSLNKMWEKSYQCMTDIMEVPIEIKEVEEIIQALKLRKATGWDKIAAEHIKYGGRMILKCITIICNLIVKYEHIPANFKLGVIVPIPKGIKDRLLQDNHRGITLLTVMSKIYEKIIYKRMTQWALDNKVIHYLQGAEQKGCSSINTAWLIKEAIYNATGQGKDVFVGLLDIRKAYDTIWQKGMFYKLFEIGIKGKCWRLLQKMYNGFQCKVCSAVMMSDSFEALQGLHQGAPCSMLIFLVFINDLLSDLEMDHSKICIGNKIINNPAFADDICAIATTRSGLQSRFKIAYDYSQKWHFDFNPSKCRALAFSKDQALKINVTLGQVQFVKLKWRNT